MTDDRRPVPTPDELLASWRARAERAAGAPRGSRDDDARTHAATPPWDLDGLVRAALADATAVLHLGDAEHLLRVADVLPPDTVATVPEETAAARALLEPRGVTTARYDPATDATLPFPQQRFDVVVDLAGGCPVREAARVLRPGGVLLAAAPAGDDLVDLHAVFGAPLRHPHRTLRRCTEDAAAAGLRVDRAEAWRGPLTFDDVGALVAHLAAEPGTAPEDFAVDAYANTLHYLHIRGPAWGQPLVFTRSRLLLRAQRPR